MTTQQNRRSHRLAARLAWSTAHTACALAFVSAAALSAQTAHYVVRATGAASTEGGIPLDVVFRLDAPPGERTVLEIPVWTPGSYRLRDFPDRVEVLGATAGGAAAAVERLDRDTWQVLHPRADALEVRYRVMLRADDRFMDPSEQRRCLTYEGPHVYLYARGLLGAPCTVRFELPEGWLAKSGLEPRADGTYFAPDYDTLADCPVKLGVVQQWSFSAGGGTVEVVLDGGSDLEFEHEPWLAGLKGIVDEGCAIFGGLPCPRYVFLFTASASRGGGGLEHLNSTAIGTARARFVRDPETTFGVSAHEFFHTWNVKRLRPVELGPFAYDRPVRTTGLWLAEGVTSYYGAVLTARAGHTDTARFWRGMANAISAWESAPGRPFTSPEQASLRVWDEQPPDRVVDYYGAGLVLGLLLDVRIRAATANGKSLDDAMVAMWKECERAGRGLTSDEIAAICSATAGTDLGAFFDAHVRGTRVPDYAAILAAAGLDVKLERTAEPVLRGLDARDGRVVTFADFASVERSGGGSPLRECGVVRELDDQPVADAAAAHVCVAAAVVAGKRRVRVGYDSADGVRRTVDAAIEERARVRASLVPRADADERAKAIREGITAPRRAR